ncbi:MAG: AAA family ATPase, partial [Planctomycetaceae bacterium]|nr:AAA family ATPase [Planctomycetaceae bacterium]
ELQQIDEWHALDRSQQLQLLFTGLFHDAGKPATTLIDPETGRTRSPKHAAVGAAIARRVLRDLGCDLNMREAICALVTFHGRPPFLLEKTNPEMEVIRLSWLVSNRFLYLFALADTRGRDTKEMTRPEDNLHLWKLVSEEQACFDKPFPFANDHARFLFFRQQLSYPLHAPHEDFRCTLTLMSGLPGAGKDTWLSRHRADLPIVSLDEIRGDLDVTATDDQGTVVQTAREQCREHLRTGRNFAFNATNISSQLRKRWIELASDYNARIEIVYVEPPVATILAQNRRRMNPVPEKVILSLLDRLEPPTIAECHELTLATP